jgi:hypothetical protein
LLYIIFMHQSDFGSRLSQESMEQNLPGTSELDSAAGPGHLLEQRRLQLIALSGQSVWQVGVQAISREI